MRIRRIVCFLVMMLLAAGCALAQEDPSQVMEGFSVILQQKAFASCTSLTNIQFTGAPDGIGPDTFADCTSLVQVDFPEGMTSLTSNAFSGCTSLKAVTFPKSLKEIGSKASPYVLPEGVTIRGYRGSRAEDYAKTFGYPFEALD